MKKKIILSNKIYPIFSGLSMDLLFWIAINTIFLTNVKHFSASQINFIDVVSIVTIFLQPFALKIIKKIGNVNSVKLGVWLLFLGALFLTFANSFYFILFGAMLYETSFIFKSMDNVILKNNLKYQNNDKEFIKYQSKASMIYAIVTMIIAFVVGFIYTFYAYLPMILCCICCFINIILSHFLYEVKYEKEETENSVSKFSFNKYIVLIIVLASLVLTTVDLGLSNGKIILKYSMDEFLTVEKVTICLTWIIAFSRVLRVLANFIFIHVIDKLKSRVLYLIGLMIAMSFVLIIIGYFISNNILGLVLMAIGFSVYQMVRDPFSNFIRTILLDFCEQKDYEKAITYLTISNKMFRFIVSMFLAFLLLKVKVIYAAVVLLIIALVDMCLIYKLNIILKVREVKLK